MVSCTEEMVYSGRNTEDNKRTRANDVTVPVGRRAWIGYESPCVYHAPSNASFQEEGYIQEHSVFIFLNLFVKSVAQKFSGLFLWDINMSFGWGSLPRPLLKDWGRGVLGTCCLFYIIVFCVDNVFDEVHGGVLLIGIMCKINKDFGKQSELTIV